jgi:malate dehydrogenase (quinone)
MAKAYGIAATGAPPMSVPHLDTRVLDGKRLILFGPFATFSTKFLKQGSLLDLLASTSVHNAWPMVRVGVREFDLVQYLIGQVLQSDDDRFEALRTYFPEAKKEDWRLWQAGQRVQIIKKDEALGGVLKLGTEVVTSRDGSIAGLLGASPGASTAAPIMLDVLNKVFKNKVASPEWQAKIKQIIPSYGIRLNDHPDQLEKEWAYTNEVLQLEPPVSPQRPESIRPADSQGVASR